MELSSNTRKVYIMIDPMTMADCMPSLYLVSISSGRLAVAASESV